MARHVVESFAALPILDTLEVHDWIDIGSGGGFPAIPLKLARPEWSVGLVESRRLKALFLRRVGLELGLGGYSVWTMRAERLEELPPSSSGADLASVARASGPNAETPAVRPEVDVVTVRAVASLSELTRWSAPVLRPGGRLLAFKGSRLDQEIREWKRDPGGWDLEEIRPAGPDVRIAVLRRT